MEGEWPDARLNELARRVDTAATKDEMQSLRRELTTELKSVNVNVDRIGTKLDKVFGDPVGEDRQKRAAVVVAVIAACSGVTFTSLIYFLTGASVH